MSSVSRDEMIAIISYLRRKTTALYVNLKSVGTGVHCMEYAQPFYDCDGTLGWGEGGILWIDFSARISASEVTDA